MLTVLVGVTRCRSYLNYCNGHGVCDYCTNKCKCNRGYGAPNDIYDRRAKAKDCAGHICPAGPSFTNFKPGVILNSSSNLPPDQDGLWQDPSESEVLEACALVVSSGEIL